MSGRRVCENCRFGAIAVSAIEVMDWADRRLGSRPSIGMQIAFDCVLPNGLFACRQVHRMQSVLQYIMCPGPSDLNLVS